jgi:hypothetical protein
MKWVYALFVPGLGKIKMFIILGENERKIAFINYYMVL